MALNYKYLAAAIAIPEVCRFITAYAVNSKQNEALNDYFTLNPLGVLKHLYDSINAGNEFKMNDIGTVLGFFALGIAAPVACYFALSAPRSIVAVGSAVALCATQCGIIYSESRE